MEIWDAQTIQAVWFSTAPKLPNASKVFEACFGREPDAAQVNNVLTPSSPFYSTASGQVGPATYYVTVQPGRVDVHAGGKVEATGEIGNLPLGSAEAQARALVKATEALCNSPTAVPLVYRVALVTNLYRSAPTIDDVYGLLMEKVGDGFELGGVRDFLLQFSKQKQMKFDKTIQMNRLQRLASVQQQQVRVDPVSQSVVSINSGLFTATHQVDTNTVPQTKAITVRDQAKAFKELLEENLRIARCDAIMALDV